MGETTIEWTATVAPDGRTLPGFTFNGWLGCEKVALPGETRSECDFCYAERGSKRLAAQHHLKLWDGDHYFTGEDYWRKPLSWDRLAQREGLQLKVFCASYGDVGEDRPELVAPRARLVSTIAQTPHLVWLLLSKRPENLPRLFPWDRWPSNVWAGTTVGLTASLPRIDALRKVSAGTRFVSFEPLLEDLEDTDLLADRLRGIAWSIIGGESGPRARPFVLKWGLRVAEASARAGAAVFWKQIGARPVVGGQSIRLKDTHGGDVGEWPDAVPRVRDWPEVRA